MDSIKNNLLKKVLSFKAAGAKKKFTEFNWQQVKHIAVIVDGSKPSDTELVNFFIDQMQQADKNPDVLCYLPKLSENEKHLLSNFSVITLKDMNWAGQIKSGPAKMFFEKEYHLLINFSDDNSTVLNLIAAQADIPFKVVVSKNKQPDYYHLQFNRKNETPPASCIKELIDTLKKIKVHVER